RRELLSPAAWLLHLCLGLCPISLVSFACYGSLLAKKGHVELGRRCIMLAQSLLDEMNDTVRCFRACALFGI
ncbi:hypothetical protein ACHAXN_000292, partial [Cyclotella atomus]